jgi:hypothetical protein
MVKGDGEFLTLTKPEVGDIDLYLLLIYSDR